MRVAGYSELTDEKKDAITDKCSHKRGGRLGEVLDVVN